MSDGPANPIEELGDEAQRLVSAFGDEAERRMNKLLDERLRVEEPKEEPPAPKEGEPPAEGEPAKEGGEDEPPTEKTLAEKLGF